MQTSDRLKAALAPDDIAICRALLRNGSKTFYAASFLLPRRVRDPATALYAFCRIADDAVDEAHASDSVLESLAERLADAYRGEPQAHAADRAFANTVRRYAIPLEVPAALIEGFAWDAEGRRYETFDDLEAYAARVAGTVGVMMALLMGARDPGRLARACDLGIAMQLSNIARDVGEDARRGRLYLPLSWMRNAGVDPDAFLADPEPSPALSIVIERLLETADIYYRSAEVGIGKLPSDCRPGIRAARKLYAAIGHQVRLNGYDSVTRRAVVPGSRKLKLLAEALGDGTASMPATGHMPDCLPVGREQVFVSAVSWRAEAGLAHPPHVPWWDLYAGWIWAIELFLDLGKSQTAEAFGSSKRTYFKSVPGERAAASMGRLKPAAME
ncbi:MAG: phytoene/squalene synthase family protein [Hyphomicrobium sp.]|nr:phytoene/squalene synthase family protein [Hyphomicrobium sp.]